MIKCKDLVFWLPCVFLAACSPKVVTVTKTNDALTETPVIKSTEKFSEGRISVLIPFELDEINVKTATKAEVEKRAMPIDFYQGLKMGIDSAASLGLNFQLNVIDTEEDFKKLPIIFGNENFKNSNLVIGPIFPDGLKGITSFSKEHHLPVVSPLAASPPAEFANPNLISIVNNIELHAQRVASYIADHASTENTIVVIINPKKSNDEQFAAPIRNYFSALKKQFLVQEYSSMAAFETKMQKAKQYAVIVTSSTKEVVNPAIDKLFRLKNNFLIQLYGHPNWSKLNLSVEKLQGLNTLITSSYYVNYKRSAVNQFIKLYRAKYGFEPSEYSFKGFDTGYYFGALIAKYGKNYLKHLPKEKYIGLHNDFTFVEDENYGFINTHVILLQYKNFELIPID